MVRRPPEDGDAPCEQVEVLKFFLNENDSGSTTAHRPYTLVTDRYEPGGFDIDTRVLKLGSWYTVSAKKGTWS